MRRLSALGLLLCASCNPFGLWDEPLGDDEDPLPTVTVGADDDTLAGLTDYARPDGSACARTDTDCLHVGAIRTARVPIDSCADVSVSDTLSLFTWTCASDRDDVIVRGALRDDRGLADLVNADALTLRKNRIEVRRGDLLVARSDSAVWWPTAVRAAVGNLTEPDTLYVATDGSAPLGIAADHVAVVTAPGVTLAGAGSNDALGDYTGRAFTWIEGDYRAADEEAIDVRGAAYLLVRRVSASGARASFVEGIAVDGTNLTLQDVVTDGPEIGVRLSASDGVRLHRVRALGNAFGIVVNDVSNLVASEVTVTGASSIAIDVQGGGDQRWRNLLIAASDFGFSVQDSADIALADVTTVANNNGAVVLFNAARFSIAGHLSINDDTAVRIDTRADAADLPRIADLAVIASTNAFSLLDGDVGVLVPSGALFLDAATTCVRELAAACPTFGASAVAPNVGETISGSAVNDETDAHLVASALAGALTDPAARGPCTTACTDIDVSLRAGSVLIDAYELDQLASDTSEPTLAHARELTDGDTRCEEGESCVAAPNLGAYQGHGPLLPAKDINAGGATFSVASRAHNGR